MSAVLRVLQPEASEVVADLRRYADAVESGEINATTVFCIFSDRVAQTVVTKVAGERVTYSQLMGLCAYASAAAYQETR